MIKNSVEINVTKGILTIGMIFAHTIQLLAFEPNIFLSGISRYTNLVSFSGFYFCFGYAVWIAYLQKEKTPWKPIIKTALKCYLAFLMSGIAFLTLVANEPLELYLVFKVALLRIIPGYSEFLISFALVIIVSSIFSPIISWCTNGKNILLAFLLCVAFMLLPENISHDPYIGLLIGGKGFAYFPVIQYLPLFLLGAYLARHNYKYNQKLLLTSFVLVLIYSALVLNHTQINRFPPSVIWIFCSIGLVYIYYGTAILINKYSIRAIRAYLNAVGQNVLFYLLVSNISIFSFVALGLRASLSAFEVISVFLVMMLSIFFLQYISVDISTANNRMNSDGDSAALHRRR